MRGTRLKAVRHAKKKKKKVEESGLKILKQAKV
jgi:hypothetical protein